MRLLKASLQRLKSRAFMANRYKTTKTCVNIYLNLLRFTTTEYAGTQLTAG